MRTVYVLESKSVDKKGREKNAKHLGIFKSIDDAEKTKQKELELNKNIVFHMYVSQSWI